MDATFEAIMRDPSCFTLENDGRLPQLDASEEWRRIESLQNAFNERH